MERYALRRHAWVAAYGDIDSMRASTPRLRTSPVRGLMPTTASIPFSFRTSLSVVDTGGPNWKVNRCRGSIASRSKHWTVASSACCEAMRRERREKSGAGVARPLARGTRQSSKTSGASEECRDRGPSITLELHARLHCQIVRVAAAVPPRPPPPAAAALSDERERDRLSVDVSHGTV